MNSILAPSILAADHSNLITGLREIKAANCSWVHLDIMDGHFVPNLSFGPQTIKALSKEKENLFFDTHLMLDNPQDYIDAFADAGSDQITIHLEPDYDIENTLRHIKSLQIKCGIALNPGTPAEAVKPWMDQVDLILIMTVWPGFGGQSFIADTINKMEQINRWRTESNASFRLQVDGGINLDTATQCQQAGVDTFVAGTAFFKAPSPTNFRKAIEEA